MILQALAFYVFAASSWRRPPWSWSSRNPVHSVLFLILAFFNAAGAVRADRRGVPGDDPGHRLCRRRRGAVPVRRDDARHQLRASCAQGFLQYLPIGATDRARPAGRDWRWSRHLGVIGGRHDSARRPRHGRRRRSRSTNTHALGRVLYTHYFYLFQAAGLVLLVAMIGAIVLTLRTRARACAASASAISSTAPTGRGRHRRQGADRGRACDGDRSRPLPDRRRDPVHARHLRHLPEPQERHHHPDVASS